MAKPRIRTFAVSPSLPPRLRGLGRIAYNLWWCWNPEAVALFSRIDPDVWDQVDHSPVRLGGIVSQSRLNELAEDDGFLAHLDRVESQLNEYMNKPGWFAQTIKKDDVKVAYFSAEFGIHESIPIYSGGLGLLAGDHLKSASDLGLPLVGVGLMYRQGYFRQYMNTEGWQQETYPENDFYNLPLIAEKDQGGKPLFVTVPFPGREIYAKVWRIQVGRVPLYLLDCNVPQNSEEDREITAQLYGGDLENRIKQELVLGVGGYRAIRAKGFRPTVCHMNEGHSAFLALERIRYAMDLYGLAFTEAKEMVASGNVFTTHTPVPAGNDRFPPAFIDKYLEYYLQKLNLSKTELMALGREITTDTQEYFCMTVLALKLSNVSNGVSKLHGSVSRRMWKRIWPDVPESELPISHITNGVHHGFWINPELAQLFRRYLGCNPAERPCDHTYWDRINKVPDAELWRTIESNRQQLIIFARLRLRKQLERRGALPSEIALASEVLNPDTLTIAFARRSATYKRGTLIFRDLDRLNRILNNKHMPVQLLFSGKAHPHDKAGKELLKEMIHVAKRSEFRHRIVFLEDYDINVARHLVQGVDIWLNNPRRPLEASGTSGMKCIANGGLHLSILDGWWDEGYARDNGFAIGNGEEYTDVQTNEEARLDYQDAVESQALYHILEQEIIPLYYRRGEDGVPHDWLRIVKNSFRTLCPFFNTNRMVEDYIRQAYLPSHDRHETLFANHQQAAKDLAVWRTRIEKNWPRLSITQVEASDTGEMLVGKQLDVRTAVVLSDLVPTDVEVQLLHGKVDAKGQFLSFDKVVMNQAERTPAGAIWFQGSFVCQQSGNYGFAVRVLPKHENLASPFTTGLILWN
ncbi:MAG: alpha-glucan family phosphorylase [Planctomycetia bacterium]|nr:alpha-glucan family phosphorylase [Planctomycetia bacterium]